MVEKAVYPGTFDPITNGHLDLILRSAAIFSDVTVAVAAVSEKKGAMFGREERVAMVREATADAGVTVSVDVLDSLLVDFCRKRGIRVVIRGLRAYSDFENEFQMSLTNRRLAPEIETFFLMPQEEHSYVTATTVREIVRYGASAAGFVPPCVQGYIERFLQAHNKERLAAKGVRNGDKGAFDR
ncbi:MAG: pantetheine-phosphate adenylyltransferase [Kiritimatiellia bacterium]|jgi:pantetheine-phosphate adenylyltransferase